MPWQDLPFDDVWRDIVRRSHGRDELPDIASLADFALSWPRTKDILVRSLTEGTYAPQRPVVLEMAKNSLMSRPITIMHPDDRVVYSTIVATLAPSLDEKLSLHIYSARVNHRKPWRMRDKSGAAAWGKFHRKSVELAKQHDYPFMLTSDVASFYEYVVPSILIQDLQATLGAEYEMVIDGLSKVLNDLNRSSAVWGLPQGVEPSGVLANFYLLTLDRLIEERGVTFVRYGDDVRIFADNELDLRRLLRDSVKELRGLHLNFSGHKTKLLEGEAVHEFLQDAKKSAIQYSMSLPPSLVEPERLKADLRAMFDAAVAQDPPNSTDVSFSVYRLQQLGDDYAAQWVLNNLVKAPFLGGILVPYLEWAWKRQEGQQIEEGICQFLNDPSLNIYPFLEAHLVRVLIRADGLRDSTHTVVWRRLNDNGVPGVVRQFAARCIGVHSRPADGHRLRTMFNETHEFWLSRALLIGHYEAAGRDSGFLGTIERSRPELARTCQYLRSRPSIPRP